MLKEYVYLICTEDNKCKVGRSTNPYKRFRSIQCHCPLELEMVHLIEMVSARARDLEGFLHRHYESKHLRGEWFQLSEEDLEDIARKWPDVSDENHSLLSTMKFKSSSAPLVQVQTEDGLDRLAQEVRDGYGILLGMKPGEEKDRFEEDLDKRAHQCYLQYLKEIYGT